MVAIPHVDRQVLVHCFTDGKTLHRFRVDANDGERSRLRQTLHRPLKHDGWSVTGFPIAILGILLGCDLVFLVLVLLHRDFRWAMMRGVGVDSDRINGAVYADAAGELPQSLRRVFLV